MYIYPKFKLMRANFLPMLGLRAQLDNYPASMRNDAAKEIRRTEGGATLAAFFVTSRSRSATTSTSALRESSSRSQPSIVNFG